MLGFKKTRLWQTSLEPRPNDPDEESRAFLRDGYLRMRENAEALVQLIPEDCRDLTVHDITHLDALWEMADTIAGPDFQLNPLEAFTFGASVLIHDAGMSVAAYPGGTEQIRATVEWKSVAFEILKNRLDRDPTDKELWNPPEAFLREINFAVLRALHARHAEELISAKWRNQSGKEVSLLENSQLLYSLGESIGRIAHSHHWDPARLPKDLRADVGAIARPNFPINWTLNEIKVACLLRCADAAHIDARRAPTFLFTLRNPRGISADHWTFQNRLTQPTKRDGALVYASGQSFHLNDARSWWLCYDTISMINGELQACSAILRDLQLPSFEIVRVFGADNPTILSKQIRAEGWTPIKAEIGVSDPVQLALTLGGKNLYGTGALAPIRELLQNGIDAVRARRKFEGRPNDWGAVQCTLEQIGESYWLHVDDTGIGMSEGVLVGPLLDFGKSLWNSTTLQSEFPGTEGARLQPIGKFGIGFFSIFLLGGQVRVISRRYTDGASNARALEISSISERPILRSASLDELPQDFITRISVKLDEPEKERLEEVDDPELVYYAYRREMRRRITKLQAVRDTIARELRYLTAAVDVDITVSDKTKNLQFKHSANWLDSDGEAFLREVLARRALVEQDALAKVHAPLLVNLSDDTGQNYGRAALASMSDDRRGQLGSVSVGGFLTASNASFKFIGVLKGETSDASRRMSNVSVPPKVLAEWASRQAELYVDSDFSVRQLLEVSHSIVRLNGNPKTLPFCFAGGRIVSKSEFDKIVTKHKELILPLTPTSGDSNFRIDGIAGLTSQYYNEKTPENLVCVSLSSPYEAILEDHKFREEVKSEQDIEIVADALFSNVFSLIAPTVHKAIGGNLRAVISKCQLLPNDQYPREWVLKIHARPTGLID